MFEWDHRVSNGWNADTWCLGKSVAQVVLRWLIQREVAHRDPGNVRRT
ncbi:MAG TPA: hypothetical protein VKB14_13195 [Actinomycetales bacterium]|nr:hypothetical protein [Actinomycetales bacterium]